MSLVKHRDNLARCALGWSDAVPQSWQLMPCRAIVEEKSAKNENSENQNYLSLMANVGIIPYEEKGDVGNKKPEDLSKCKLVSKGDLVINSMNYGIGSYGLSSLDGVCSPVYIVLKPKPSVVHERYALRIFESKSFQQYAQSFGTGILEHRAAIGWDDLKNIKVGIPSLEEQQWLLDYLDRETTRIDALITKKTRFIELLREKRQALITHAVTKGIDPNVKMKDSGVEWLGEVPEHWSVSPLKYVLRLLTEKTAERSNMVSLENIEGWTGRHITTDSEYEGEGISFQVGDILFGKLRPYLAKVMRAGKSGQAIGDFYVLRPEFGIQSKYAQYWLLSAKAIDRLNGTTLGAKMPRVSWDDMGAMPITWPSLAEQKVISAQLDRETAHIDTLIAKSERSIELLKERRSALITAAVTGQIDLREAA